jgi:hypothetical protein
MALSFPQRFPQKWAFKSPVKGPPKKARDSQNFSFFRALPEGYSEGLEGPDSDSSRTAQEPHWQKENGTQQSKYAMNGHSQDTEWECQEPHDGIEHQRQER